MTEERVVRLLSELASEDVELPDADTTYWRARVQMVLDRDRKRRAEVLRPLRVLHLLLGLGSIAAAPAVLPLTPTLGLLAAPLSIAAVALGGLLLLELNP